MVVKCLFKKVEKILGKYFQFSAGAKTQHFFFLV